jgi:hypothetical protein
MSTKNIPQERCYTPLKGKAAYLPDWPKNPVKLDQIPESENIGLLLEHAGLVDVDMDSLEAQYTVPAFLDTKTLAVGRGGKIRRYLYEGTTPNRTFTDLTGDVLLEVRHKGKQTMWAGSTHPDTRESIEVMRDVRPLPFTDEENVYKAATSALIARHLPTGGRHDLAMAYSGFLLRKGLTEQETFDVLWAAWELNSPAKDADRDLWAIITDTKRKIDADEPATGGNTLGQLIPGMTDKIIEYWGWDRTLTPEEKEEEERQERVKRADEAWPVCEKLARKSDILGYVSDALNRAGLVGQRANTELVYLCFTSRGEDKPVPFYIDGPSAAGKSERIKRVSQLFPESALYELTAMSERALAYLDEDMRHRYLVVYEMHGVGNETGDYLVRSMLSEGCIRYQTNESTNQGVKSRLIEVPGPTGLAMTTTSTEIHAENATRMLRITEKDTREHTREVMRALANEHTESVDTEELRALQTWIEGQDNRVTIPFAPALAELASDTAVRMRRDFGKLLTLIRTHAVLHQATRRRNGEGKIVATFDDYERVRALIEPSLGVAVEASVKPEVRETVEIARQLAKPERFTINDLKAKFAELTDGLDRTSVQRRVKDSAPYLVELGEKDGRAKLYGIGAEMPEDAPVLPDRDALEREVCNCARVPRGVSGNAEHDENCPAYSCTVPAQMHAHLEDVRGVDGGEPYCNKRFFTHHDTEEDAPPTPSHSTHTCTVSGGECPNPVECAHSCTEVCTVPIAYRLLEPDEAYCERCSQYREQDVVVRPLRFTPEDRIWFASEICRTCGYEHPGFYDDEYVERLKELWGWCVVALEPTPAT